MRGFILIALLIFESVCFSQTVIKIQNEYVLIDKIQNKSVGDELDIYRGIEKIGKVKIIKINNEQAACHIVSESKKIGISDKINIEIEPKMTMDNMAVFNYFEKKRDPNIAGILSAIVPGAGCFYCRKPIFGIIFFGLRTFVLVKLIDKNNKDIDTTIPYFCATIFLIGADIVTASHYSYVMNHKLMIQYKISL